MKKTMQKITTNRLTLTITISFEEDTTLKFAGQIVDDLKERVYKEVQNCSAVSTVHFTPTRFA